MKRPEYVYEIVRVYRKAIDEVLSKQKAVIHEDDRTGILKLFNRTMTTGHLFHQTGYDLMNPVRPNHMGIELGKVLKTSKGKITIELSHDLHQNDGIRILSSFGDMGLLAGRIVLNGRLVNGAKAHDIIELETSLPVTCRKNDQVVLTTDKLQCEIIGQKIQIERRFSVDLYFHAEIGKKAQLTISDGVHCVSVESEELVQRAQKQPVTEDKIMTQLSKLNDSIYVMNHFELSGDSDLFLSLKTLNQMRRDAVCKLNEERLKFTRFKTGKYEASFKKIHLVSGIISDISVADQLEGVKGSLVVSSNMKHEDVYVKGYRADELSKPVVSNIVLHTQIGTMNAEKGDQIWICDASLNATNSYALEFLIKQGADAVVASLEADDDAIDAMIDAFERRNGFVPQVGKMMYGRREMMIMKACLINAALGNGKKTNCSLCRDRRFALVNEKGQLLPVSQDGRCHPIIYDSSVLKEKSVSDKISLMILRFTDESSKQCKEILKYYENIFRRI